MGLCLATVLEIFNHPDDLVVVLGKDGDGFVIFISRGPGHDYKPLVSSQPIKKPREDVVAFVGAILTSCREAAIKILQEPQGEAEEMAVGIINPGNKDPANVPNTLTEERINLIIDRLGTNDSVDTSKLATAPAPS